MPPSAPVLEQAPSGQLPQQVDGSDERRRCEFLGDCLSALRAESQDDRLTIGRNIRFEQRRRPARAIEPRVALASSAYGAARDKLDDGRGCELPGLEVRCKILADAPADLGQRIREPSQPARLAQLAHVVPLRVIAVLQPASGVTPDGLEMGGRIRRVEHILVGRRHGEAGEAADDPCILDRPPIVSDIGPASAATAAPDRQRIGRDVPQTEPLGERNR